MEPSQSDMLSERTKLEIRPETDSAHNLILAGGTKHSALFREMSSSILNLQQGFEALEAFRKAEAASKSKRELACVKGFSVGRVKFVIRHQFGKSGDMTPSVFASVVTLAADRLFRERLVHSDAAMKSAHSCIRNSFAARHGFALRDPPETPQQVKMFYFYLTTTIGVHALMEGDPVHCLTIGKWRLQGSHMKKLGLPGNLLFVDQAYLKCLKAAYGSKFELDGQEWFNPDDYVKNECLLKKVQQEFKFLKSWASPPKSS